MWWQFDTKQLTPNSPRLAEATSGNSCHQPKPDSASSAHRWSERCKKQLSPLSWLLKGLNFMPILIVMLMMKCPNIIGKLFKTGSYEFDDDKDGDEGVTFYEVLNAKGSPESEKGGDAEDKNLPLQKPPPSNRHVTSYLKISFLCICFNRQKPPPTDMSCHRIYLKH